MTDLTKLNIGGSCSSCGAVAGMPHKDFCLAYPPKDKETKLSEKAAKFLGADEDNNFWVNEGCSIKVNPDNLFCTEDKRMAPSYFAHLAEEKLHEAGYIVERCIGYMEDGETRTTNCLVRLWGAPDSWRESNPNKFKALWLAIEQTGVLDETPEDS